MKTKEATFAPVHAVFDKFDVLKSRLYNLNRDDFDDDDDDDDDDDADENQQKIGKTRNSTIVGCNVNGSNINIVSCPQEIIDFCLMLMKKGAAV